MATATTTSQRTAASVSPPTTIHLRAKDLFTPSMADPSTSANQASNPPAAAETLTCKACARTLATSSADGELRPHGALDEGCTLCKDMMMHCNEYEEVKGYFKELEHRRDDYGPRQLALEVVHGAQMALGNFVQDVAKWGDSGDEDGDEAHGGAVGEPQHEEQEQIATATSTPPSDAQSRRKRSLSPASSPSRKFPKRPRLSERQRRVSFDPSVVFRDAEAVEKRVDAEFSRSSEGYSPGRYAAPDGTEWLDTSGNSLRETQFFGVQKRGRKWVPTKEGREMDEEWEMAGQEGQGRGGEVEEEGTGGEEGEGGQEDQRDKRGEGGGEGLEAIPSSNISLPHRTSTFAPDSEPSSERATDIAVDEHSSIFGDGVSNEAAPLNKEQKAHDEDIPMD